METILEEVSPQVSPANVNQPQLSESSGAGVEGGTKTEVQQVLPEARSESLIQEEAIYAAPESDEQGLEALPDLVAGLSSASPVDILPTSGSEGLEASTISTGPLQTLTSGRRREVKGGVFQAHICVVASEGDVATVMDAFRRAEGFTSVACWSYAYRIHVPSRDISTPDGRSLVLREAAEDGIDEGSGERILGVLRRFSLHGLLLVMSRWQDYGVTSGLELLGTALYSVIVERCKDLIVHLREAVGLSSQSFSNIHRSWVLPSQAPISEPKVFNFGYLPPLVGPRPAMKYGPNHFMADMPQANKMQSLPHLFGAGADMRQWMVNDRSLQRLPESEIRALRAMRLPDARVERVLQAVALLRGHRLPASTATGSGASRWAACRELLRSPTLRTELLLFNANDLSLDVARTAMELLDGLSVDEVLRISAGAAALLEWALGVSRWRLEGPQRASSTGFAPRSAAATPAEPDLVQMARTSSPLARRGFGMPRRSRSAAALHSKNMRNTYGDAHGRSHAFARPHLAQAAR
mmetsp:Transcript_43537/g.79256  ORF Transcript_43537/g.79256 Transcript_43537/m.79256 type:complete len:525 (-) Transcript_43537:234-1808(-)